MSEQALQATLRNLEAGVRDTLSEDEVEHLFDPLYTELGYTAEGRDILRKRGGKSGIPDVRLQNSDESTQVVVELKRPSEGLADHQNQITRYLRDLKAPYGILSNGRDLWLYRREGLTVDLEHKFSIANLAEDAAALAPLQKRQLDPLDFDEVRVRLESAKEEGLELRAIGSLPSEQFLNTFSLKTSSPFGKLVLATQDLLLELEGSSPFVGGSFDFWQKVYARNLSSSDTPKVWQDFLKSGSEQDLSRFMFALETAYILAARLLLAKAVQDHDARKRISREHMADRFLAHLAVRREGRGGALPAEAYPEAAQKLFDDYAQTLFTSIYAQDLFDWWRDYRYASQGAQDRFALAMAGLLLSLIRFDFSTLEGDLLGELYQSYFDPDTRKALGEFYTPPEVVDFILDEVGYDGAGRLLDPATGSGTFLIHALRRYLKAHAQRDPVETLRGLTESFQIVAFDVNPFAVMMAQINFAAHLVPLYARAVSQDPKLVLRRLPVVRTDSLRQEVIEGEQLEKSAKHGSQGMSQEVGFAFGSEEITAYIELPIKAKGGPLKVGVTFPNLESAKQKGVIRNEREWLLALQAVFAAVEKRSQAFDRNEALPELRASLRHEIALYNPEPDKLEAYLEPYAAGVWEKLEDLKTNYGDGRFLKTLEDLMLGLVLKHYLKYDYVVGNPPYVRIQNIPELQKKYWADKYVWAKGNYDIFIPFIERVLYGERPWLKDGGKLGFIVPNRFLNTNYAAELRASLPRVAKVLSVTDFKAVTFAPPQEDQATRLFKEAMVYPAILTVQKGSLQGQAYTFKAARFYPKRAPIHPAEAIKAVQTAYRGLESDKCTLKVKGAEYADVFTESSAVLEPSGWYLMPRDEREVFEHLEAIGESIDPELPVKTTDQKRRLENYTATESGGFAGIQTSLDSIMVLKQLDEKEGELYLQPRGGGAAVWIEKEPLRKFLFGKDVERWHVGWEDWWVIFPYFRHDGRYWFMPSSEYWEFTVKTRDGARRVFEHWPKNSPFVDKRYPKLYAYLEANEKALRGREGGRWNRNKRDEWRWYDLARPQSLEAASQKKIVTQLLARSAQFAYEGEGGVHFQAGGKGGGVYGLLFNANVGEDFALGLLNSRALDFYLKHVSSVYSSGFYSYADAFLKLLPIACADMKEQEQITSLAQSLTEKTAELRRLEQRIAAFPGSVTEARREAGSVPDVDDLSRLVSWSDLPKTINCKSVSEQNTLSGDTVLAAGRGEVTGGNPRGMTLKPSLARLVMKVLELRGKMERDELLRLEAPIHESDQQDYLEQLAGWKGEVEKLEREICQGELELNALVYDLYGMDGEERKVIEGFLARF